MLRRFWNWIKRHRGDIYGIGSLIGLGLTVLALVLGFSASPPAPSLENETVLRTIDAVGEPTEKRRIVENSFGELNETSKDLPNVYSGDEQIEELFLNRWIGENGWRGFVDEVPRKTYGGKWEFRVWEDYTGERFDVETENVNASDLREGDRVHIKDGRIAEIGRAGSGWAYLTLDNVTIEVLAPLPKSQQWWRKYSPFYLDSLTSPFMWVVYWWWTTMVLLWLPTGVANLKRRNERRRAKKAMGNVD